MKLYKLVYNIYCYWKNAYTSGYVKYEKYFTTEQKAKKFAEDRINQWCNYHEQYEPIPENEQYKKGFYEIYEIEVEE